MLLDAPFVAVTQIIVYAGAIMVLFLFVVMLLNVPREDAGAERSPQPLLGAGRRCGSARVLAVLLAIELVWALSRHRRAARSRSEPRRRRSARSRDIGARAVHRLRVRVRGRRRS